ncbi:secreted RxLR effector protein 161-like [Nicotiana tabacum]|uniref:Secreted RxLR effector protein 161-like n=1 Tax=Nicotiana tabacum TaxID=4097 RepID=A0AC58S509_TOBAC
MFGMSNAKAIETPTSPSATLDEDKDGESVDETMYRGMIGSLFYLIASQPDIMFSVCKCARYQSSPKESHLTAVKCIIRYLIGTIDYGLWYECLNVLDLKGFSDADFAGDKIYKKSTSGTCQLLEKFLISWHSKKQSCVALSTTEVEHLLSATTAHKAKHIEIKHQFIRDHVAKCDIVLEFINTENQLADIFTKPLLEERFCFLHDKIGICLIPV